MGAYRFNSYWVRVVCAGSILASSCANPAPLEKASLTGPIRNKESTASTLPVAEISNGANQPPGFTSQSEDAGQIGGAAAGEAKRGGDFFESAKADLLNLPNDIIEGSRETFLRSDNLTALLLAGGASIAMHNSDADENLAGNFKRHRVIQGFADEGLNVIGSPGTHFAITGLWYALSVQSQDEFNTERAWTMMTALSVTGLTTVGLKAIRTNDTPNGKSWAWPSGHTSSSFTVASVLDEFYGPKVGIPAYILASLVAYRMMDEGDHWASDIVFGAALGWVVGHTIAGKHKELEFAGFKMLPYTAGSNGTTVGINLVKQF